MYPLSFSRLKNIEYGVAPFIAACIQPKKPSTKEQMLGRVIHRALLFGDYKTFCVQELDKSIYPSTIADMAALVGKLPSGAKKDDYELACANAGIVTLSQAEDNFGNPTYKVEVIEAAFEDGTQPKAGTMFTFNSSGTLKKAFEEIEDGQIVKVIYKGEETVTKGKFKGKSFHSMEVLVAPASSKPVSKSEESEDLI
jgi:hypothetical protein